MITFERTTDYALLNSFLKSSPSLFPFLGDDFAPSIEDAAVIENPNLWYILAREDGKLMGFWMFEPRSAILFDFHSVLPLDAWAVSAMKALLGPGGWLWNHSPCLRAATFVPAYNKIAQRFGLRAGLTIYGRNPDSYLKHGQLQDQILMGISKPKET